MDQLPIVSDRLRHILEQRLGMATSQSRDELFELATNECPPVDPYLIRHLEKVFTKGGIKVAHPQLANLLLVQYGIDLIVGYLKTRYDAQSAKARKEYER